MPRCASSRMPAGVKVMRGWTQNDVESTAKPPIIAYKAWESVQVWKRFGTSLDVLKVLDFLASRYG